MNEVFTEILKGDASCLFDNCVDLFKYIEFDSSLQLHYSGLPLKLDIVKCRLGRFGAAIRKTTDQPLDRNL
ncbi:HETS protein, partial [Fusarium beomiforme]